MAHTDGHGAPLSHETRDVNLSGAPRFAIAMVVFLALVFAFVWFVYAKWRADANAAPSSIPAIALRESDRLPPLPRLQTTPSTDLRTFQESEAQVLTMWVDKEKGVVRIRCRAIECQRGLPAPIAASPDTTGAPAAPPQAPPQ